MKSIHRVGLTIASLVSMALVSGVFVVQGYVAGEQTAAQAAVPPAAVATVPASLAPLIVYVNPAPTTPPATAAVPAVAALPAVPAQQPQVIHVIVPSNGDDGGSDG